MRRLLPAFIYLSTLTLSAQITIDSAAYFPIPGDTLLTIIDNAPMGISITPPGGDQSWNFATLQGGFVNQRIAEDTSSLDSNFVFPQANVRLNQTIGGFGYYRSSAGSFALHGSAGEDPLGQGFNVRVPFEPPYVERWAPLNFFDQNLLESDLLVTVAVDDIPGNLFDNLPISPDSIRVRANTNRVDLVDAWGTVTIPGGIYDVLREKRTEIRDVRLEAKVGLLPWVDVTNLALENLPIEEIGRDTIVTYTFWSNEAKEPIALITAEADGETIVSVEYKSNNPVTPVIDITNKSPQVFVYPNPAIVNTRFEFANVPKGNYQLAIYNLAGQQVWAKRLFINDYLLEKVNVTSLRKGIYLYALTDEQGRRLAVNRLMITSP